ncbi:hypothetical protein BHYA_0066g00370 [Botrytis hyacinthi]|uniref:Uncharacterized protein n=1 Tax=Botrytis hyacinthi TaxID=278943 RepID=A0A4Z1GR98_9HELO|nr:hypothetical protein BHYA_0066g00370 [Botrytis hyacinthi]
MNCLISIGVFGKLSESPSLVFRNESKSKSVSASAVLSNPVVCTCSFALFLLGAGGGACCDSCDTCVYCACSGPCLRDIWGLESSSIS